MERGIRLLTVLVLAGTLLSLLAFTWELGRGRFFTRDEYQWGHATWLVQQGQLPYRDFYEHHLPLGYLAHAAVLPEGGSFAERALFLRTISFAYLLAGCAALALAAAFATGSAPAALLAAIVPLGFGFSLMSAIEYRADNWSGFLLLVALSLLEIDRRVRRPFLAAVAGVSFGLAVLMTQKLLLLGGLAVAAMLLLRATGAVTRWREPADPPLLVHPLAFCTGGLLVAGVAVAAGAATGLLSLAWEINVVQAIEHERLYPDRIHAWRYVGPFFASTWVSTSLLLVFGVAYLRRGLTGFWFLPLVLGLAGGAAVRAQYPYNYVLLAFLLCTCAVREYVALVERLQRGGDGAPEPANARLRAFAPLLYLLPLLLLPGQLEFVTGRSGNLHQLRLLELIERHTEPGDVVLDDAGGALFRPHRGYYWYHDRAHVELFRDYFQHQLVGDLAAARAPFWIRGTRMRQLPIEAQRWLTANYLPFDGSLYVLGFSTEANPGPDWSATTIEVVRAGEYHVSPPARQVRVEGEPVVGARVHLEQGPNHIAVGPSAPMHSFTWAPLAKFADGRRPVRLHAPGFEYRVERAADDAR